LKIEKGLQKLMWVARQYRCSHEILKATAMMMKQKIGLFEQKSGKVCSDEGTGVGSVYSLVDRMNLRPQQWVFWMWLWSWFQWQRQYQML